MKQPGEIFISEFDCQYTKNSPENAVLQTDISVKIPFFYRNSPTICADSSVPEFYRQTHSIVVAIIMHPRNRKNG